MIACAIAGFIVLWKMQAYRLTAITCAWTAIILIGAYGLLSGLLSFPSLPAYEQNEFGNRLLALAHVALLPLIAVALTKVAMSVFRPAIPVIIRSSTLLACGLAATGALYISFPHNDAHVSYHGYNVSRSDIDAVRWIHGLSGREPIVVLSNQVTAAASIREFGFLRYYPVTIEGKIAQLYTYSIPTTSPLAELFREMVRKPSRETMRHAMDLVGVKRPILSSIATNHAVPTLSSSQKRRQAHGKSSEKIRQEFLNTPTSATVLECTTPGYGRKRFFGYIRKRSVVSGRERADNGIMERLLASGGENKPVHALLNQLSRPAGVRAHNRYTQAKRLDNNRWRVFNDH